MNNTVEVMYEIVSELSDPFTFYLQEKNHICNLFAPTIIKQHSLRNKKKKGQNLFCEDFLVINHADSIFIYLQWEDIRWMYMRQHFQDKL